MTRTFEQRLDDQLSRDIDSHCSSPIRWWYSRGVLEFGRFHLATAAEIADLRYAVMNGSDDYLSRDYNGPFDSFAEAKRDATEYFKCDLNELRSIIKTIRATKREHIK